MHQAVKSLSFVGFLFLSVSAAAAGGLDSIQGTSYFVDCRGGDDSKSGRSHAERWRTLGRANAAINETGADLWLLQGTVCEDQSLRVDWDGTAGDRVHVGTYYVASGTPHPLRPQDPSLPPESFSYANGTRAEINGTYDSTCSRTLNGSLPAGASCAFDGPGAVPSSKYSALVVIAADYVTVQDLSLKNSAGWSIAGSDVGHAHVINNRISNGAGSAVVAQGTNFAVVRGNQINGTNLMSPRADALNPSWGSTIVVVGNKLDNPAHALVENNSVYLNFGEGIAVLKSNHVIIRRNYLGQNWSANIYMDNGGWTVVEYNLIWGGRPSSPNIGTDSTGPGNQISIGLEAYGEGQGQSSTNNVVRGNVVAHTYHGINFAIHATDCHPQCGVLPLDQGLTLGAKVYHNTFVDFASSGIAQGNLPDEGVTSIDVRNNIFHTTTSARTSASICNMTSAGGKVTFSNNFWSNKPAASTCNGQGDVYGDPMLLGTSWTSKFYPNQPKFSDFALKPGSPALTGGVPISSTLLVSRDYPQLSVVAYPCAEFDTAGSVIDAFCNPRASSRPSFGALEGGSGSVSSALELFVD